ncbi:hypothetical protein EC846_1588 [Acinetobacter sp. BIGb0102]|uniref:hypothetical protein n=1 Tax=Acinetobacter sp. BIGb0102 TaxID=2485131 RepID=UPI000F4E3AB6|nr:hypothetical protein [Acinetobacter sp. BIGb0102]RPE30886.1 hypothetical protein EC846_1588 [Acinetobacter sp. BIGb0102]
MFEKIKLFFSNKTGYELEFSNAVKNTLKNGLGTYKSFKKTNQRLVTDESLLEFHDYIKHLNLTPDLLVAQCLGVHYALKPYVDEFYGVNSILTIGHIERKVGGKAFYEPMEERITYFSQPRDITKPTNIHVWLTLPTLEILDFTLPTTLSYVCGIKEWEGAVIAQHGDDENDHFYKPEFVGIEFLYKAGLLKMELTEIF